MKKIEARRGLVAILALISAMLPACLTEVVDSEAEDEAPKGEDVATVPSADEVGVGTYWKTTASDVTGPCLDSEPWVHVGSGPLDPKQNINTKHYVGQWDSSSGEGYAVVDYWMVGATSHFDIFRRCSGGHFVNVWYRNGDVVGCFYQSYNFGLPTGSGYIGGWSTSGGWNGTCPI